jgi:hypothetical protein
MVLLNNVKYVQSIKPSCPLAKHCAICDYIGYYAECPVTLGDRILVEIKEGVYRGETPYTLLRRVRRHG